MCKAFLVADTKSMFKHEVNVHVLIAYSMIGFCLKILKMAPGVLVRCYTGKHRGSERQFHQCFCSQKNCALTSDLRKFANWGHFVRRESYVRTMSISMFSGSFCVVWDGISQNAKNIIITCLFHCINTCHISLKTYEHLVLLPRAQRASWDKANNIRWKSWMRTP